jgi:hypothetical protein
MFNLPQMAHVRLIFKAQSLILNFKKTAVAAIYDLVLREFFGVIFFMEIVRLLSQMKLE